MKRKGIIIGVILSFLTLSAFAADHPWELKKNAEGIQVFVREVDGSSILEYKGSTIVEAGLDAVLALYEQETRMPEWFHQCVESRLLNEKSPEDKIFYFVIDLPFPVKDRDSVFERTRSRDAATGSVAYQLTALPDFYPRQKGKIRTPYLKGVWRFTPLGPGRTEVYYQQHSEVGGHIPAWLVNRLAVNIPFESLFNFRRLLTEKKDLS